MRALMDLRAIAINSKQAETEGAYMRTYQYSMMMIVRWMTQYSLESAKFYDVRDDQEPFALYEWAQQSISEGRQFIIDGEVERVQLHHQ